MSFLELQKIRGVDTPKLPKRRWRLWRTKCHSFLGIYFFLFHLYPDVCMDKPLVYNCKETNLQIIRKFMALSKVTI